MKKNQEHCKQVGLSVGQTAKLIEIVPSGYKTTIRINEQSSHQQLRKE